MASRRGAGLVLLALLSSLPVALTYSDDDLESMKVKELKMLLEDRGVKCPGCTEKADFIKRVRETADADSADADEALPVAEPPKHEKRAASRQTKASLRAKRVDSSEMSDTARRSIGKLFVHYCLSWGYKNAFMEMAHHVRRKYPDMHIVGEPLMPPPHKMYASYALRAVFFVGLFVQIFGAWVLPKEFHEKYVGGNRMAIFIAMMMANMASGSMLSTQAFEIAHDGKELWSAIEVGRLPSVDELFKKLSVSMRS